MKMYILITESVPVGFAILAAAHASLAAYLKFKDSAEVAEWLQIVTARLRGWIRVEWLLKAGGLRCSHFRRHRSRHRNA